MVLFACEILLLIAFVVYFLYRLVILASKVLIKIKRIGKKETSDLVLLKYYLPGENRIQVEKSNE